MILYFSKLCSQSSNTTGGGGGWWFMNPTTWSMKTCTDANLNAHKPYYRGIFGIQKIEMKTRLQF